LPDPEDGLVILKSFVSSKGTKRQITEGEVIEYSGTFGKNIETAIVKELIQKFIGLRILRDKDENGRYELRHDSLATKIYEKITLVEKELLEVKFFIENAYNNYEKRNLHLTEEDLSYIAPYEDKLFLGEKILRFISGSKKAILRNRRRRQNILIAAASVIIAVLSFFTIWAMSERRNAVMQRHFAESQRQAEVKARMMADSAMVVAISSRKIAEANERQAMEARNEAEVSRQNALAASRIALEQRNIAEQLSVLAKQQASKAEEEKQQADQQRAVAQAAEEKAKRLSMLSLAQTLALKVMSDELKPEANGLTAVQAYRFNKTYGGAADDPVIFKALDKSYNILDSSRHTDISRKLSLGNEIRDVVEFGNDLLGADLGGSLLLASYGNNDFLRMGYIDRQYNIDFISLGPGGKNRIVGYDDGKIFLQYLRIKIPVFSTSDKELIGHRGSVKATAWSRDGNYAATGGGDSLIFIWKTDTISLEPVHSLRTPSVVKALAFADEGHLISSHSDGSVIFWDLSSSKGEIVFSPGEEKPLCLAWNNSTGTILSGCSNGTILLICTAEKPFIISRFAAHSSGIDKIAISADNKLVSTSSWDKVVRLYNYTEFFENGNSVKGAVSFNDINLRIRSLLFTSDMKLVAAVSDKTGLRIWETSSEKLAANICRLVKRDMTTGEWSGIIGEDIPYEKTCSINK
jgi:WD40 repeat protein